MVFILSTNNVLGTPPIASKLSVRKDINISCDFVIDNEYVLNLECPNRNTSTFTSNIFTSLETYHMFSFLSYCACSAGGVSKRTVSFLGVRPFSASKYARNSVFLDMYALKVTSEHSKP